MTGKRWQIGLRILIVAALAGEVIFSSFACRTLFPGYTPADVDWTFYRDEMEIESLIQETDTPARKTSLRLIAQALKEGEGFRKDTLEELERALRVDPQNPYAYYFIGLTHLRKNQFQNAIPMAKRAEQLFAQDPLWQAKALVIQAKAQSALSRVDDARRLYERAQVLDPKNPWATEGVHALGSSS